MVVWSVGDAGAGQCPMVGQGPVCVCIFPDGDSMGPYLVMKHGDWGTFQYKHIVLSGIEIPIIEIRQSHDCLIFIDGYLCLESLSLY